MSIGGGLNSSIFSFWAAFGGKMERAVFFSDSPSAFPEITELPDEIFLRLLPTQRYLSTVEWAPTLSARVVSVYADEFLFEDASSKEWITGRKAASKPHSSAVRC